MVRIGIIDDNNSELDDIRATIFTSWKKSPDISEDVDFKPYSLEKTQDFKEKLESELLRDIENRTIQSLIVDYKLDSLRKVLEGKDVVEYLRDVVPAFPVVILTNAPSGSKKESEIDPDKVYDKHEFLKVNSSESDEMSLNIYLNIKRYIKHRGELEAELEASLNDLTSRPGADIDIGLLSRISEIEVDLSKYVPIDKSHAEKLFDLSELKGLIEEISKLEGNLE